MYIDPNKIERISPGYWRNSHLSVARLTGAIVLAGHRYILDQETDELVRSDIHVKDLAERARRARQAAAVRRQDNEQQQIGLFL